MPTLIEAGRPSAVWLHAPWPIPPETSLTLWLRGPKTLRGVVAERDAPTINIEAHFAVKVAGEYTLLVEEKYEKRKLLQDTLTVVAGPAHTASCALDAEAASADGRRQVLRAVDAFGNKHAKGGTRFTAMLGTVRCAITDVGDGTYVIDVPPAAPSGPGKLRISQAARHDPAGGLAACLSNERAAGEAGAGGLGEVLELPVYIRKPEVKPPATATCELMTGRSQVGRPLRMRLHLYDKDGQPGTCSTRLHA